MELPHKLDIPFKCGEGFTNHEDSFICCRYRHLFMENGIKYAPLEVAKYFGHETMIPEIEGIKPFLFHKWGGSNKYYKNFDPFEIYKKVLRKIIPMPIKNFIKSKINS